MVRIFIAWLGLLLLAQAGYSQRGGFGGGGRLGGAPGPGAGMISSSGARQAGPRTQSRNRGRALAYYPLWDDEWPGESWYAEPEENGAPQAPPRLPLRPPAPIERAKIIDVPGSAEAAGAAKANANGICA